MTSAEHVDGRKRRLLELARGCSRGSTDLRPRADRSRAPLGLVQRKLWLVQSVTPESTAYNQAFALELRGPFEEDALRLSLEALALRHEPLRTRFVQEGEEAEQRIEPAGPVHFQVVDARGRSPQAREDAVAETAFRMQAQPFDLSALPLFRVEVLRIGDERTAVIIVIHHIIADEWSMLVVIRELEILYAAALEGRRPTLEPLDLQYGDYAAWQHERLAQGGFDRHLDHWRGLLSGELPVLELPADLARTETSTSVGAQEDFVLDAATTERVRSVCAGTSATPFMVYLALIFAWLNRSTGQSDLIIGCPIVNRTSAEVRGMIGFFANTMVVRARIADDTTLLDLVRQCRDQVLTSYDAQDVPIDLVLSELRLPRLVGRSPVFQALFNFENIWAAFDQSGDRLFRPIQLPLSGSKFDVALYIAQPGEGAPWGALQYAADVFDELAGARMAAGLVTFSESLLSSQNTPLSDVPLADAAETGQALARSKGPPTFFSGPQRLDTLVVAQASRTPHAPACRFEGRELTYGELLDRARRIEAGLLERGVGRDDVVGVTAARSLDLLPALLGVMMAGAAYAPLDIDQPIDLLASMVARCDMCLVLADQDQASGLADVGAPVVTLPSLIESARPDPGGGMAGGDPEDLAYVIFTSGSTGAPKACMVPHVAICNRLNWMQDAYGLTPADRVLQKTPTVFDVSVWELFWPLMAGAAVVLARSGGQGDADYLGTLIAREAVTTLHFVPSMLGPFMDSTEHAPSSSLRRIICSGETLGRSDAERVAALYPAAKLHNLYGPTEAAVDVTAWTWTASLERERPPIGSPIANVQTFVLDPQLRPLPTGIEGDLYIGGVALARGYRGDPGRTADRFVPHPFETGRRLYRTGDRARWLPGGNLEFLGRRDHQVKLRGYRIELGQIEAALAEQPGVDQAVVLLREDIPGDRRLVGYIQPSVRPEDGDAADVWLRGISEGVARRLPSYMQPRPLVVVDEMPRTATGKIDRKALPTPDLLATVYIQPVTPVEIALADIWREVLGGGVVGVRDNFFDRGGDSIRAISVVARARKAGLPFSIRQVFQHQTIADLADQIEFVTPAEAGAPLEMMTDEALLGVGEPDLLRLRQRFPEAVEILPLSATPSDMYRQMRSLGRPELNLVQVLTVSSLHPEPVARAYRDLAVHNPVLRSLYAYDEAVGPIQVVMADGEVPVVTEDWRELSDAEQRRRARAVLHADSMRGPDLDRPSATRIFTAQINDDLYIVIQSFNYMCLDGWSMLTLAQDVGRLIHATGLAEPRQHRPPYRRYLAWRASRDSAGSEIYWREQLDGCRPAMLSDGLGRPEPRDAVMAKAGLLLKGGLSDAVRRRARHLGVTENLLYQTCWALVVAHVTGRQDMMIGVVVAGRTPEVEDVALIVGHTMNYLPFRITLDPLESLAELTVRISRQNMGMMEHDTVSQEQIRQWSGRGEGEYFFDSLFYFQNLASYFTSDFSPLVNFAQPLSLTRTAFPLRLDVYPTVSDIGNQIAAGFDTSVFRHEDVMFLLRGMAELLHLAVVSPEVRTGDLLDRLSQIAAGRPWEAPTETDRTSEDLW